MSKLRRSATDGAFVSVSSTASKGGSVFRETRLPDGSRVVSLNRDSYDRAILKAKIVLGKKPT